MKRPFSLLCAWVVVLMFTSFSCEKDPVLIVPQEGYDWPEVAREYWPTSGWRTPANGPSLLDEEKIEIANKFALNDSLTRALLIVKDGYLAYEKYYGEGGIDQSTNLWSVTKSISSILVGMIRDDGLFNSTHQLMADLLPQYPEFGEITLHHVLTQTTGLSWAESGPLWVEWIMSDDWVTAALARGQKTKPGKEFYYSSGNSHFLTSLAYYKSFTYPGIIAKERLFEPLGISIFLQDPENIRTSWDEYTQPLYQSWRKDPKGIECAGFALYLTARDMAKIGYLYLNKGKWDDRQLVSEEWVVESTRDHQTNIYGRYSYGYQWWIAMIAGHPAFFGSGFGGQILGIVPSLDLVVVIKYEAERPVHPVTGSNHDDMHLFELAVESAIM